MKVSNTDISPLARVAQLERDIAGLVAEKQHIKERAIIALRRTGLSLRDIGAKPEINLSHTQVALIIKVYEAVNGPIRKAGAN